MDTIPTEEAVAWIRQMGEHLGAELAAVDEAVANVEAGRAAVFLVNGQREYRLIP